MRWVAMVCFLAVFSFAGAQEVQKKKAAKPGKSHSKPTAEQIRKFNELEKKQQKAATKP